MRIFSIVSLLFSLAIMHCHAELIEYAYSGSSTVVGAGDQTTHSFTGVMLIDTATSNITFVGWRPNKTYTVGSSTNYHHTMIVGPSTRYTVITHSSSGTDTNNFYHLNNFMLKGLNKPLTIATGKKISFPAVFSGTNNRDLRPDSSGMEYLDLWSETMSFMARQTVLDNDQGLTNDDVVARITASLENRGYIRR